MSTSYKPLYLKAENAYSFDSLNLTEAEFAFKNVRLILGKNYDQDTDNGAGKSTILKLIFYSIYGEELNGSNLDDITKEGADGHCVEHGFLLSGQMYRIKRYRNWTSLPGRVCHEDGEHFEKVKENSGLKFYVNGEEWFATNKVALQNIILGVFKISKDTFLSSILIKQRSGSPFLLAEPKEKSKIISQVTGTEEFKEGEKLVKSYITAQNKTIASMAENLSSTDAIIASKRKDFNDHTISMDNFEKERRKKLSEKKAAILKAENDVRKIQESLPVYKQATPFEVILTGIEESEILLNREIQASQISDKLIKLRSDLAVLDSKIKLENEALSALLKNRPKSNKVNLETDLVLAKKRAETSRQLSERLSSELSAVTLPPKEECSSQMLAIGGSIKVLENRLSVNNSLIEELNHSMACPTCKREWDENTLQQKRAKVSETQADSKIISDEILSQKSKAHKVSEDLLLWAKKDELSKQGDLFDKVSFEIQVIEASLAAQIAFEEKVEIAKKNIEGLGSEKIAVINDISLESAKLSELSKEKEEELKTLLVKKAEVKVILEEIAQHNASVDKANSDITLMSFEATELKKQGTELKNQENPYVELRLSIEREISKLTEEKITISSSLKDAELELKYLEFWKEGFGDGGIRSFVSDDLLLLLNEKVNEYLSSLYNGALSVNFSSISTNSKGIESNEISVKLFRYGKEVKMALWSGGEIRRVEFAINLAFLDLVEMYSGFRSEFVFMDEPFDGICARGQAACLKVLRTNNEKTGRKFFLVTLDGSIQSLIADTLRVEKRGGSSEIVTFTESRTLDSMEAS